MIFIIIIIIIILIILYYYYYHVTDQFIDYRQRSENIYNSLKDNFKGYSYTNYKKNTNGGNAIEYRKISKSISSGIINPNNLSKTLIYNQII